MRTRALERVIRIFPDLKEVQLLYFENRPWELLVFSLFFFLLRSSYLIRQGVFILHILLVGIFVSYERGKNAEIDHLVSVENLRIKDATGAVLEVEESHGGLYMKHELYGLEMTRTCKK